MQRSYSSVLGTWNNREGTSQVQGSSQKLAEGEALLTTTITALGAPFENDSCAKMQSSPNKLLYFLTNVFTA